jgi:hypothetical protein
VIHTGRAIPIALIALASGEHEPPTAFRLFKRGWNDTEKGRFLFDDKAARAVMAAHEAWGVDVMIDLEHQSLNTPDGAADPTARDARGWAKLELRNGDLWMVGATWTPDGAQRLQQKRQRYVSPAFEDDPKTKRIVKIVNVAITALPATHQTPALVAASRRRRTMPTQAQTLTEARDAIQRGHSSNSATLLSQGHRLVRLAAEAGGLDPELVKQALDAVEKGDAKAAIEILKGLIASAAGAEPEPDGDEDGSEGDGAEGVAPPATATDGDVPEEESVEHPVIEDGEEGADAAESPEDEEDGKPKPKKMALRAGVAMLLRIAGTADVMEALNVVETWKASHIALETERKQLAKERAILTSAERRKLVVELIQLGADFPATIWADPTMKQPSKLKSRWEKMPIEELRAHVTEQRAARKAPVKLAKTPLAPKASAIRRGVPGDVHAPTGAGDETDFEALGLDANDLQLCKATGCEPAVFARLKNTRNNANARGN